MQSETLRRSAHDLTKSIHTHDVQETPAFMAGSRSCQCSYANL